MSRLSRNKFTPGDGTLQFCRSRICRSWRHYPARWQRTMSDRKCWISAGISCSTRVLRRRPAASEGITRQDGAASLSQTRRGPRLPIGIPHERETRIRPGREAGAVAGGLSAALVRPTLTSTCAQKDRHALRLRHVGVSRHHVEEGSREQPGRWTPSLTRHTAARDLRPLTVRSFGVTDSRQGQNGERGSLSIAELTKAMHIEQTSLPRRPRSLARNGY